MRRFLRSWLKIIGNHVLDTAILAAILAIIILSGKAILTSRFAMQITAGGLLSIFLIATFFQAVGSSYRPGHHLDD